MPVAHSDQLEQSDSVNLHYHGHLLDVKEAARLLNVTPSWVYEHCRSGVDDGLPFVKLGKYLRFTRRDLDAYIERQRNTRRPRVR